MVTSGEPSSRVRDCHLSNPCCNCWGGGKHVTNNREDFRKKTQFPCHEKWEGEPSSWHFIAATVPLPPCHLCPLHPTRRLVPPSPALAGAAMPRLPTGMGTPHAPVAKGEATASVTLSSAHLSEPVPSTREKRLPWAAAAHSLDMQLVAVGPHPRSQGPREHPQASTWGSCLCSSVTRMQDRDMLARCLPAIASPQAPKSSEVWAVKPQWGHQVFKTCSMAQTRRIWRGETPHHHKKNPPHSHIWGQTPWKKLYQICPKGLGEREARPLKTKGH